MEQENENHQKIYFLTSKKNIWNMKMITIERFYVVLVHEKKNTSFETMECYLPKH